MASPADSDSEQVETSSSSSEYQGTAEDRMITGIPEANLPPRGKKRKLDIGAFDEEQLSLTEPGDSSDEDPVEPHSATDRKYMKMASEEAQKSPDKKVQVGAVIVNKDTVLGKGYNRMPVGCEQLPWSDDEKKPLESKYPYVFHGIKAAISDAIKRKNDLEGATVYTTLFPANTDAQWIIDLGMKELVYRDNTYKHTRFAKAARRIFETSGIRVRRIGQENEVHDVQD